MNICQNVVFHLSYLNAKKLPVAHVEKHSQVLIDLAHPGKSVQDART